MEDCGAYIGAITERQAIRTIAQSCKGSVDFAVPHDINAISR
jgi:hypothetical protein